MALDTVVDTRQQPAKNESSLCRHLDDLWEEGHTHRERVNPRKQRDRDRKLYRGEVGPKGQKPCRYKLNFLQAFIDRQVAQLTQSRPINRIEARKSGLRPVARVLTKLSQFQWDASDMQRQTTLVAKHAALDGASAMLTLYDPATQQINLVLRRIGDLVVDPAVTIAARVCTDAEYVGWCDVMPLSLIRQLYPARGRFVRADQKFDDLSPVRGEPGYIAPTPRWIKRENQDSESALPRAEVRTMVVKDRQKSGDGTLLFPTGRMIVYASDTILWDGPNPYWDGEHPIDIFEWMDDPDFIYGHSAVELLRESQLSYNALMDGTVTTRLDTNFVNLIADWNAFDETQWRQLQSLEGTNVIQLRTRGARAEIAPPPMVAQDAVGLAKAIFTSAQVVTGCTDAMLGESPGSLQSGAAVEGLQESASLMTAARQSRLEDFYARVGQKLISRQLQWMDGDRVMAMMGEQDGDAIAYAKYRNGYYIDENGKGVTIEQRMRAIQDFKFGVVPGSSGPNAKRNRAMLAGELKKGGMVPSYYVLEAADIPNPKELAEEGQQEMMKEAPLRAAMKA